VEENETTSDDSANYYGSWVKKMRDVKSCTDELIQAILESEEYTYFSGLRDRIKDETELRRQLNEFRLHVFEVQNTKDSLDMYEEQKRLCRDYEEFRKNPLVNDFLLAELSVCRMIQQISEKIVSEVNLDTDEITERMGV
jgi:cell fate (sporulation/competence/biofilm development) regulator YlbF (YheA/YmcA/DUF963 family)